MTATLSLKSEIEKTIKQFVDLAQHQAKHGKQDNTSNFEELVTAITTIKGLGDWEEFAHLREWIMDSRISKIDILAEKLETLPIDLSETADYRPMFFLLDVSLTKWIPCYNAEVNEVNGWAILGIRDSYDSISSLATKPGHWAHSTQDDTPSMPWAWSDDNYPTSWV